MTQRVRVMLSIILILIGTTMLSAGIWKHKTLWTGINVITKEVVKEVPAKEKEDAVEETGTLRVEYRWHFVDNECKHKPGDCTPSGEYQLRDTENKLWVIKFCDPVPDIKQGSTVDIKYMKYKDGDTCTKFVNAKIIWEPLK